MQQPQQPAPDTVWRTGSEQFTITEAHPYHEPVGRHDPTGAGAYRRAYAPECPRCRAEEGPDDAD